MSDSTFNTGTGGDHSEALRALESLDSQLSSGGAAAMDSTDLCQQYQKVKPLLNTAITLVQAIPVYGPRIASAIRFLMSIADQFCAGS